MADRHLIIVISSLQLGGAERVAVTMANALSKETRVTLLSLSANEKTRYPVSENVEIKFLDLLEEQRSLLGAIKANIIRIKCLRATIRNLSPDILVSFMLETNVLMAMTCFRLKIPLFVCEHTDPRFVRHKLPWRVLRRLTYRFSSHVIVLNQYMKTWFEQAVGRRIRVIANPIKVELSENFVPSVPGPYILATGRLIPSKCFDDLIRLFANLVPQFPEWRLVIIGEGEQMNALHRQVNVLGLEKVVYFPGSTSKIHNWMQDAEIFASTSKLEAFPMAVSEAMMCSTPVVVVEYNEGVRELVPPHSGFVLKKANGQFEKALTELMQDASKRKAMGRCAAKEIEKYSEKRVMDQWRTLFEEYLGENLRMKKGVDEG